MAVSASFSSNVGLLSVLGDGAPNNIIVSRDVAGKLLVNGGAVKIKGGNPTVANTGLLQVFGQNGNDVITIDESKGALPRANLFGGSGNDTITGGSGADQLFGQADNDILLGRGGFDFLFGGSGNDTLTGGDGDDQVFGESGDDRMIWNPGDDSDLFEGGTGTDTAEVNGGGGAEIFTLTANGTRVRFDRLDPAPFALDIGTTEKLVLNMNGGDDSFSATGNLAALIGVTVDGGAGNDTIFGSNGVDLLLGGEGNDFIDGQQGNDVLLLGAGDDIAQWDPGDGSDTIEGQDGVDTMLFNGSGAAEIFGIAANGGRVLFTRNVANIVMDLNDVESIDLNALGNTDTINIGDLSGTDVTEVNVNLAGTIGGTTGDAQADVVIATGTSSADIIDLFGAGTSVSVLGLAAQIDITNSEGANDTLVINGLGGDDGIMATTLPVGVVKLTLDGGTGNDTILGSQGADTILGGDGDDFVFADNGNDIAFLGADDDIFQWDPGDGNDTIEGQDGIDALLFFGSNVSENVNIVGNGERVLFTRDVANVVMDLNDMEVIELRALGGTDNIVVGDLGGTDVTSIGIDLRGPSGGGDGAADTITVNATQGADTFGIAGDAGGITIFGLSAGINIFFQEVANDRVVLNGQGGDDVIDATSLEADGIQLTMNGGLGADIFLGSEGDDLVTGGDGDDTALLGAGDDSFVWNPGDDNDVIEGQDGFDTMLFNGANVAEQITISANGGRVLFNRDIANVVMDLNDVEAIGFTARGGADTITINDLSGTDLAEINLDLSGVPGSGVGDGAADTIIIQATNGDDVVLVVGDNGGVSVLGLSTQVNITGFDLGIDKIIINTLGGDDVVEASGLNADIVFQADGGDQDDILIGGAFGDTLFGGFGDDVLIGNAGLDILDGGAGTNVVIQ